MDPQKNSSCTFVTYIKTTPDELWKYLTNSELIKKYWFGYDNQADWTVGAAWKQISPDGKLAVTGEIMELERPLRIVLSWRDELRPENAAEGISRCEIDIVPVKDATKLTIRHSIEAEDSKFIALVANAWPMVLSNLKSLLETGEVALK